MDHCSEHDNGHGSGAIRLGGKLRITLISFAVVFAASFLPVLEPLNEAIISYLAMVWWAILLGFLIGGMIDWFIPEGFIRRLLGNRDRILRPGQCRVDRVRRARVRRFRDHLGQGP